MTPLIRFNKVFLKREDLNPTGSAKDRAITRQLENLVRLKYTSAAISSTGNAAISAQHYCAKAGIKLTVFVSPHTSPAKLKLLPNARISDKPISDCFKFAKLEKAYNLRQSTDPAALDGYAQIGKELSLQCPHMTSLFVPVGSGATLLGISRTLNPTVRLFAVQPASNPTIVSFFGSDFVPEESSVTDALSVRTVPLKKEVISVIKKSNGSGIVVQNDEVIKAQDLLKSAGISTSPEGALAFAGWQKAKEAAGENPVILLTGTKRQ